MLTRILVNDGGKNRREPYSLFRSIIENGRRRTPRTLLRTRCSVKSLRVDDEQQQQHHADEREQAERVSIFCGDAQPLARRAYDTTR